MVLTSMGRWKEASNAYGRAMVYDPNDAALVKAEEEVKKLQRRFDLLSVLLDGGGSGTQRKKVQLYPYLSMPPMKESKQVLNQINLYLNPLPNRWRFFCTRYELWSTCITYRRHMHSAPPSCDDRAPAPLPTTTPQLPTENENQSSSSSTHTASTAWET